MDATPAPRQSLVNALVTRNPALPWAVLFLFLCLGVPQFGGTNARARIAGLRAITEGGTLSIDNYRDWTADWALSPNGHYYSNKAPGPVLLGLPVFALTDLPLRWLQRDRRDAQGRLPKPPYYQLVILNLTTQMLPFALLVLYLCRVLAKRGAPLSAIHFFAFATLLGNTAAIYMNVYFGHGMAALFFLGAFAAWIDRRYTAAGCLVALSMLVDYGTLFVLPFFALATLYREKDARPFLSIVLGALPAALLWTWYHWTAFGSPFLIASQFTNPAEIYPVPGRINAWGQFAVVASPEISYALLFGMERGILVTQPWILLGALALVAHRRRALPRGARLFLLGGLGGLLWMNSGFGGWHGGFALGPRYLSVIFPAFALALAWEWGSFGRITRTLLWATLGVALLFRVLVYPFASIVPLVNLWAHHWRLYVETAHGTPFLRLALALAVSAACFAWARSGQNIGSSRRDVPLPTNPRTE